MDNTTYLERLVFLIVKRMEDLNIIDSSSRELYLYQVEVFILKITGILVLAIIGICTANIMETIIFYITFSALRSYTHGYHANHYIICLLQSSIIYMLICQVFSVIVMQQTLLFDGVTLVSLGIIFMLSAVNSDSVMLTDEETARHKHTIKYILITYMVIALMCITLNIPYRIVAFFDMAIVLNMCLVVIGKLKYMKGDGHEVY